MYLELCRQVLNCTLRLRTDKSMWYVSCHRTYQSVPFLWFYSILISILSKPSPQKFQLQRREEKVHRFRLRSSLTHGMTHSRKHQESSKTKDQDFRRSSNAAALTVPFPLSPKTLHHSLSSLLTKGLPAMAALAGPEVTTCCQSLQELPLSNCQTCHSLER